MTTGTFRYYEYLLKQYLQTNKTEEIYKSMYDVSVEGIKDHLLSQSAYEGLVYTVELSQGPQFK